MFFFSLLCRVLEKVLFRSRGKDSILKAQNKKYFGTYKGPPRVTRDYQLTGIPGEALFHAGRVLVHHAVQIAAHFLQQHLRAVELHRAARVHHQDAVVVHHRLQAMRHRQDGARPEPLANRLLEEGVSTGNGTKLWLGGEF